METIIEFFYMQVALFTGEIDYVEYSKFMRKKENIIIQVTVVLAFLIIMGLIFDFPIYMIVSSVILIIFGVILQRNSYTFKKQIVNSFIWAITSFIVSVIVLIIAVEFSGFMK